MTIAQILKSMDYGPAPENAAEVKTWLDSHAGGFGHFINGEFTKPGTLFDVRDPAQDKLLASVTQGTAEDVDRAVAAARSAQPGWEKLPGHIRARHLYALARHIQQHARLLAVLESLDSGKPIRESRDIDIPLVARHFYHHAGWAEILEDEMPGHTAHGVCGQIIPWNFPLLMLAWKVAPALAAGNTVVLKPAEYTPLTALAFAEIVLECGLPKGVVNIVTGDGETGASIVAHDDIDKIAFTGSTEVGRLIRRQTAGSGKALTLELGGKSPFIVFDDADLDAAVEGVVDAIWFNQGQVCCAGSRILVAESVSFRFETLLRARMKTLRTGDPLDKNTDVGAIVHPSQLDHIRDLVAEGQAEGALVHQSEAPSQGCFFPPTLVTGVNPANVLSTEEIFGPVVTLTTFRTPSDALALANNTRYGLAASIWSENVNLCLDIAGRVNAGIVWINCTNIFDAGAGFGGYRESGFGREGGREGMRAYLRDPALAPNKGKGSKPGPLLTGPGAATASGGVDRTAKLYIGGKQTRPDSGYSYQVIGPKGRVGLAGLGNRKDIRNAVEAATKASGWGGVTGHNRAQVLYYIAENLSARAQEFTTRLETFGTARKAAEMEVETAIGRCFWYAAQADKFDGAVHSTKSNFVTLALNEALGVMGVVCPDALPLLGAVSVIMPAIAMGNRVVVVPSQSHPLAACDLYQVLETSDLPAGVVNIVTGARDEMAQVLAAHDGVDGLWYFGEAANCAAIETESAGNIKQTWAEADDGRDWMTRAGQGRLFLEKATQVKNIWVPYGS